ncbi:MAG TPA: thioredoxin domain-containing protein [Pyrinomonadaceae bacterium]|nr:thioredoxin domain-containing protein [Pyrinomonadaceae bacterium]
MSKKQFARQKAKKGAASSPAKAAGRPSWLPLVIIGGALLAAVVAGVWLMRSTRDAPADAATQVAAGATGANPPQAKGSANAPVTIEEFGDYECPPCGALHPELEKIKADYGDRVRLVFRHYPLVRLHQNALAAAHAAEAAGLQGKFWEMHDRLYRGQKAWAGLGDARRIFTDYARDIGLDAERFARDMNGDEADRRIVADHERARSLGVNSTPVVFVNGRKLPPNAQAAKDVRAAIDTALGGKQ